MIPQVTRVLPNATHVLSTLTNMHMHYRPALQTTCIHGGSYRQLLLLLLYKQVGQHSCVEGMREGARSNCVCM